MKALLLATLYATLRLYVGAGVFDRLARFVAELNGDDNLPGREKMQALLGFASGEVAALGETLVRACAEIILLRLRGPAA